jgi:hypothetical protein
MEAMEARIRAEVKAELIQEQQTSKLKNVERAKAELALKRKSDADQKELQDITMLKQREVDREEAEAREKNLVARLMAHAAEEEARCEQEQRRKLVVDFEAERQKAILEAEQRGWRRAQEQLGRGSQSQSMPVQHL